MSLLAHLASQSAFRDKPENIATECLCYILNAHEPARAAFLRKFAPELLDQGAILFRTQGSNPNSGRPDLVGKDRRGKERLIIEIKFDAGLTGYQTKDYFDRVEPPGVYLFVAPEARREWLWLNLRNGTGAEATGQHWEATLGDRRLLLRNWHEIMDPLRAAAANPQAASDLDQFLGLIKQFESDAFTPFEPEELHNCDIPRFIRDLLLLLEAVGTSAVSKGIFASSGRWSWDATWGGKSYGMGGLGVYLKLDPNLWRKWSVACLWLTISRGNALPVEKFTDLCDRVRENQKLLDEDPGEWITVPLLLKPRMSKDDLTKHVVAQLQALQKILQDGGFLASP